MRRAINYSKVFFVLILVTIGAISCNKNEIELISQDTDISSTNLEVVTNKLGVLEFKNFETFKKTVEKLKTLSFDERIAWEGAHHFTSLSTTYHEVLKGESDVLKSLTIDFKEAKQIKNYNFPSIHSDSFKKYRGSIISTGEKITDTPVINIGIVDYATVVNEDGFVIVGNALIQFKQNSIKGINIDRELNVNDLEDIDKIKVSNSKTKVFTTEKTTNKNLKISGLQSGESLGSEQGYGFFYLIGTVSFSNTYILGNANDPGAIYFPFFGFDAWLVPCVHYNSHLCLLTPSWYGWGRSAEPNYPVYIHGTTAPNGYVSGNTDGNGVFSTDKYELGSVANIQVINTGFGLFLNSTRVNICSVYYTN